MTRTRWIGVLVAALVLDAIAVRLGLVPALPTLAGTAAWTTSRAAGATAFGALALDVVFGLFVSTGLVDRWVPRGASVDVHRWLSSVALTLVAVHVLALLGDATVRFDALATLVPGVSPYRPGAVGLGTLALYGALVVHLSFGWRKRIGARAWRALHFTAFAVFVAAVVHGIAAGTDAGTGGMRAFYIVSVGVVAGLIGVRVLAHLARPTRQNA